MTGRPATPSPLGPVATAELDQQLTALGRILVTGAGGMIGSTVVDRLLRAGAEVTALDTGYPNGTGADRLVSGDATDVDVVAGALADVAAVVHLGAIPTPNGADAYTVFRNNTDSTFNVLGQAADRGVRRAVIASSINATGIPFNPHAEPPAYFPIDEDLPIDLADAYSLSKQVDEHTARTLWRATGIDVVAFRFPLTAPAARLGEAAAHQREDPGYAVREGWSYLDVRDAAEAVCLALVRPLSGVHVLCLCAPDNLAGLDAAELLRQFAPDVDVREPITGTATLYSARRAGELLGWRARYVRAWETEATSSTGIDADLRTDR